MCVFLELSGQVTEGVKTLPAAVLALVPVRGSFDQGFALLRPHSSLTLDLRKLRSAARMYCRVSLNKYGNSGNKYGNKYGRII